MNKIQCPICGNELQEGERLTLEFIPGPNHWIMLHLRPAKEADYQHSKYPGYTMHCGQAHTWKPARFN